MKKWMLIGIVLVMFLLWQVLDVYWTVQADKNADVAQYEQLVPETYQIEETFRYHGNERCMVFHVQDENQEQAYFYVSENEDTRLIKFTEIQLTEEEAIAKAQVEYPEIREVLRVTPAYSGYDFTWEIIARGTEQQVQYLYYSMMKGTFQKRFTLSN